MVADICDGSRLQGTLGAERAAAVLGAQLAALEAAAREHGAVEAKSLGDGLVCHFADPDGAFRAACAMQESADDVEVKIAFAYGLDMVSVSARLAGIAVPAQVLTTQDTVEAMSPGLRKRCRQLQPIKFAGRADELAVCEVMCLEDSHASVTTTLTHDMLAAQRRWALRLTYAGTSFVVEPGGAVRLGRDKGNDVVVESALASRQHARIYERDGHFVLVDQSSNGTFLRHDGHINEIVLRHEEGMLGERGWIGLGRPTETHGDHMLRYRLERRGD